MLIPMPNFPLWNQGVLIIDWQTLVQASTLRGRWRIPVADALSFGQLNVRTLNNFSGQGPPSTGSGPPEFLLRVSLNPEGIGWRYSVILEADQAFQISKVTLIMPVSGRVLRPVSGRVLRPVSGRVLRPISDGMSAGISRHGLNPTPDTWPDRMFCNGWQSWSESREFGVTERMPPPRWIARKLFQPYGDGVAFTSSGKPGDLHSWSWTSWPASSAADSVGEHKSPLHQPNNIGFLGSLNEQDAYTCFALRAEAGTFHISRDVPENWGAVSPADVARASEVDRAVSPAGAGTGPGSSSNIAPAPRSPFARILLDLFWAEGPEDRVYDHWFHALKCQARPAPALTSGWTSWYRHYNRISAVLLEQELRDLAQAQPRPEWFQIDDGWQPRIGDWTSTRSSFPHGLKPLADQAKALGFKPGLWLAPFVAEKRSELLRQHPEWAERDGHGNLVPAGFNPLWSGTFYALNPDHPGLRDHLRHVFETVLDRWGFEGLKLDFLYAAGLQHREGRARATRMRSAMEFLRDAAGDRFLLGCGVPLAPAFGLVDACRIGADVHLAWEHRLLAFLRNRERVSTRLAVLSSAGRRGLNGRAFVNDPDVYLMRRNDPTVKLSEAEQFTLLLVNRLFGGVLFNSDAPAAYPASARALLERLLAPDAVTQVRVLPSPPGEHLQAAEHFAVAFSGEGGPCLALLNLSDKRWSTCLEIWCGAFSGSATALWQAEFLPVECRELLWLAPHHCRVFRMPAIQE